MSVLALEEGHRPALTVEVPLAEDSCGFSGPDGRLSKSTAQKRLPHVGPFHAGGLITAKCWVDY